jgi:HEPN domain-containing protein
MCQQSIEKLLEAHVTGETDALAPRIHNLVRLAEMSGQEFTATQRDLLERLSLYYLPARYPPEIRFMRWRRRSNGRWQPITRGKRRSCGSD